MLGESGGRPLRVVIDPNVFVSAAISNGASRRIVQLAAAGGFQMVACPRLLDELGGVLRREKFEKHRTREDLDRFERIGGQVEVVQPGVEVEGRWSPSGRRRSGIVRSHLTYT